MDLCNKLHSIFSDTRVQQVIKQKFSLNSIKNLLKFSHWDSFFKVIQLFWKVFCYSYLLKHLCYTDEKSVKLATQTEQYRFSETKHAVCFSNRKISDEIK